MELVWLLEKRGAGEQFHRNQAMIAHNWRWQAGWLAHYSRPALLPPARPTTSAAGPLQQRQCRHWRHHHPDAQQLPCANLQHQQQSGAATPPALPQPSPFICRWGRGRGCPSQPPACQRERFLQTCEIGAALLRPMAARPCSPAPALGNVLVMPISARARPAHAKKRNTD